MRSLFRVLIGTFAFIGLIVVLAFGVGIYAASKFEGRSAKAPDKFVLTLNLDKDYQESNERPRLASLKLGTQTSMQDALFALRRAKDDPRVTAVVATLNDHHFGIAQIQELRTAIADIRAAGKPTYLFSETIGEGTGALQGYYLAAAFETIWVQPTGNVGVAGIGTEQPFVRKALERLGVKANVIKRKEYKSAMETFTEDHISPANKEELTALLGGWFDQMVDGIAADRKLDKAAVKDLIDRGPLLAAEAKEGKLIDALGYRDQFEDALNQKVGRMAHVPLRRYADLPVWAGRAEAKKSIAVVSAIGTISRGSAEENPFAGDEGIKSAVTAKAIRDAVANKDVEAIVLRVDSPGGSAVASDTIWREVVRARESKKPVIVSMGNVAASGGYFISMAADRIFADAGTITGSIGVISGKIVLAGTSEKLDVNWDRISFGESAGLFSSQTEWNARELARLNTVMDAVYADFTGKAAQGRGKPVEEFEKYARGRVWSGADAVKIGMIDELGGLNAAIDHAKTKIGLTAEDSVKLVPYPTPEDPLQAILKAMSDGDAPSDIMTGVRAISAFGKVAGPLLETLQGAQTKGPALYMEPVGVE